MKSEFARASLSLRVRLQPPLIWFFAPLTFFALIFLSCYAIPTAPGDVTYINPFSLFDLPLMTLTFVACAILIGSFQLGLRQAYRGLHTYLCCIAFVCLALYYKNLNADVPGMHFLDIMRPVFGFFFVMLLCGLSLYHKRYAIHCIAYLMRVPGPGEVKLR